MFFCIGFYSFTFYHTPLISVIIPTYNRADLVPRAIESILGQTFKNFELIIVDDASDDETAAILKTYADADKRVKILKNEKNCGVSCARNKGLVNARGMYITMLDSDDYAMEDMLERQVRYFRTNPELAVVTGDYYYFASFDKVPPIIPRSEKFHHFKMTPSQVRLNHLFTSTLSHSGACFKKSFLDKHALFYDETMRSAEDYEFFKKILIHKGLVAWADEVWTINRRHFSHDKDYYETMHRNSSQVKKQFYEPYWELSASESSYRYIVPWERCALIRKIREKWTDGGWLQKKDVEDYLAEFCSEKNE